MLNSLNIKNYALIRELEMNPSKGLNIITGETGAGKSIMLGAIGLLLGNRADTKVLFDENEKCIIEGAFDVSSYDLKEFFAEEELDYEEQCLIRREISPQNKSRAFINDTPVTLDILKKLGYKLMDVHSQHDTLQLGSGEFQLSILDNYAGNTSDLKEYREVYSEHKNLFRKFEELTAQSQSAKKEFDYNNFLLTELLEAKLNDGEQETLEEELKLLENGEEIKSRLNIAIQSLGEENAALNTLQTAYKSLEALSSFSEVYKSFTERLRCAHIELKDILTEIEGEEQSVEFKEERITEVKDRLSEVYRLQQKHHVQTIHDLLTIQSDLEGKVSKVDKLEEQIEEVKVQLNRLNEKLIKKANVLSKKRVSVKDSIISQLLNLLKEVGMPNSSMEIKIDKVEPGYSGCDKVSILFSANKGVSPQELKNAASGGEFSRLMLCLKYIIADKTALPVIVFDEIDTGISGEISIKVGRIMKQMAKDRQVIAISHLPQIAALGNTHYFVYKDDKSDRAVSKVRKLEPEERIMHIAKMIGGETPTDTAIKNARELMEL